MPDEPVSNPPRSPGILASLLRWAGMVAAAIWLFQGASGVLLAYHFEINDSLLSRAETPLDYHAIESRMKTIEESGGKSHVNWIWSTAGLPGRFLLNYSNSDGVERMARIAGDGTILLETGKSEFSFLEKVRDLHLALGASKAGEKVLAISGIALLVTLVHAFFISWRARRAGHGKAGALGWYRRLSMWGCIPAFIVTFAAVFIFFEHDIEGPIGAPPITLPANAPQGEGVGFAAAVMAAEKALPDSRFVGTVMPSAEDASYKAWLNQKGEYFRHDGYGGSQVIVDANNAAIRGKWPLQEASTPYKIMALPYPLHTGEIAGSVGRALVLLVGIWLVAWSALRLVLALRKQSRNLSLAMLVIVGLSGSPHEATNASDTMPAKVEMTTPVFEMFRLAPGKTEAFIRSMAEWDQVSVAGGQPPTQLFLHAGGEGWDLLLYKPARPKPTPAQEAAMAAKARELDLPTGALYFVQVREQMADHTHFEATGPTTAAQWVEELERLRAGR